MDGEGIDGECPSLAALFATRVAGIEKGLACLPASLLEFEGTIRGFVGVVF